MSGKQMSQDIFLFRNTDWTQYLQKILILNHSSFVKDLNLHIFQRLRAPISAACWNKQTNKPCPSQNNSDNKPPFLSKNRGIVNTAKNSKLWNYILFWDAEKELVVIVPGKLSIAWKMLPEKSQVIWAEILIMNAVLCKMGAGWEIYYLWLIWDRDGGEEGKMEHMKLHGTISAGWKGAEEFALCRIKKMYWIVLLLLWLNTPFGYQNIRRKYKYTGTICDICS